ncbi:5828_t:CDS:1 [Gigaspora margarita]|uniref:5828_t:CDS:1 n=1 Tax=Gigaspora margarita TaxID=4874 RepID=A0ABN7VI09_GIGMA|nr:5828_t:CDS:1 [Gigaspora margarita]
MQSVSDERVNNLKQSLNLIEQIRKDNKKNQTKPIQKIFRKFYEAKKIFEEAKKEAENKYNEKLNEIFRVACALDDYETAFEFLQFIQNEGNNFTKSKVIYKIRMRLLGGFGCKQDIPQGQELIKKASRLGLTSANAWIKQHGSKNDFGASEVVSRKMI